VEYKFFGRSTSFGSTPSSFGHSLDFRNESTTQSSGSPRLRKISFHEECGGSERKYKRILEIGRISTIMFFIVVSMEKMAQAKTFRIPWD